MLCLASTHWTSASTSRVPLELGAPREAVITIEVKHEVSSELRSGAFDVWLVPRSGLSIPLHVER